MTGDVSVEDIDLHSDGNIQRNSLLWQDGDVSRVFRFIGMKIRVWMKLIKKHWISHVKVGKGNISSRVELAG